MNRSSAALAVLSGATVTAGVGLVYVPAAVIVLGLLLAGAAWLAMDVEDGDER